LPTFWLTNDALAVIANLLRHTHLFSIPTTFTIFKEYQRSKIYNMNLLLYVTRTDKFPKGSQKDLHSLTSICFFKVMLSIKKNNSGSHGIISRPNEQWLGCVISQSNRLGYYKDARWTRVYLRKKQNILSFYNELVY